MQQTEPDLCIMIIYLEELLTRQKGLYWDIIAVENDITLGAAIGGLIER